MRAWNNEMKDTTHPEYSHHAADLEVTLGTTNVHYVSTIFFCRPINSKNFRLYKPHTVAWFCVLNPLKMKNYTSLVDFTKKKKKVRLALDCRQCEFADPCCAPVKKWGLTVLRD